MRIYFILLLTFIILFSCKNKEKQIVLADSNGSDQIYLTFLQNLKKDESYIGFFAAEKKYISMMTPDYLAARKKCFLGISQAMEEPFDYVESFIDFCTDNELLKIEDEEEFEKVLIILSFELYANMPIFEFSTGEVIENRSIVYAEYPNKKLSLDLFIPKNPIYDPMPAVICIHGGGWMVNRRIWFEPFAKYLASNGIAAVTIDYRKLPAVELMDIVHDSKAAVRWLRANSEQYGIDRNRIGVIGASAGAHLATLLGTTADVPELEGSGGSSGISSSVQAVVGIATPGFTPSTSKDRGERFGLSSFDLNLLSPYENITSLSAPLYLVHGTDDQVVPPQSSQEMYDKYLEAGAYVELKWIPDADHGFYEGTDMAIILATEFFKKQFAK